MRRLSEKSKIITAKVGLSYETVYYYKQKVVNWEFVAPTGYDTIVFVNTNTVYKTAYKYLALVVKYPVSISIDRILTEESYAAHVAVYKFNYTNTQYNVYDINIISYSNTSSTFPISANVNKLLTYYEPYVSFETTVFYNNIQTLLASDDNIHTHLMLINKAGGVRKQITDVTRVKNRVIFTTDISSLKDSKTKETIQYYKGKVAACQYAHSDIYMLAPKIEALQLSFSKQYFKGVQYVASVMSPTPMVINPPTEQTISNTYQFLEMDKKFFNIIAFKLSNTIS